MKDKYPHRAIYFCTFFSIGFNAFKYSFILKEQLVIGGVICVICLCLCIVYLDLSGYLPFVINKHYSNRNNKHFDILGFVATLYLLFQNSSLLIP